MGLAVETNPGQAQEAVEPVERVAAQGEAPSEVEMRMVTTSLRVPNIGRRTQYPRRESAYQQGRSRGSLEASILGPV